MKTTCTRRQMLKLLAASSLARVVPGWAGGVDAGVVPGVVPGVTSAGANKEHVRRFLQGCGRGQYVCGQVATWVHNENPDLDHPKNWIHKVVEHTGRLPRYGCVTYDYEDNPFSDVTWNEGVRRMWQRGLIAGVYSFFANPGGGRWNDPCEIEEILSPAESATKTRFYGQLDRMAASLQWLKDQRVPVIYTPFVESDDRYKWHAKKGSDAIIRLYRRVHDYFEVDKKLDHILWAYHTTQKDGALERCYPGDAYVDVIGKSAYGSGLVFSEYDWAVARKREHGKIIWWAELGIRSQSERPRDCMDVVRKLESHYPELAGFVFWGDDAFYNLTGNQNAREFMTHPKIISLAR